MTPLHIAIIILIATICFTAGSHPSKHSGSLIETALILTFFLLALILSSTQPGPTQ